MNFGMKKIFILLTLLAALFPTSGSSATVPLTTRLKGYVLLQVQAHGEAWYVNPRDSRRYYLKDGAAAYAVMRSMGLGMSEATYALVRTNAATRARLKGMILLRVQAHGEAYYICPRNLTAYYLKDGTAAYAVMRSCGLGITDGDLSHIPIGSLASNQALTSPTNTLTPSSNGTVFSGCSIFPPDNPWNQDVSRLPLNPRSQTYINSIGAARTLHPDFGNDQAYGIPYNIVGRDQPKVTVNFEYADESDPGPYPIPTNPRQEAEGDGHILVLDKDACRLFELYAAHKTATGWTAGSGAIFDLNSNGLRPFGWTSADAAGLPVFPGLIRYEEVAQGEIKHAIRFTAPRTQNGYILPATHQAGSNDPSLPPMGLRVRLKANYDISTLTGQAKVIATAMKKYGLILADNGSSWYFQGTSDPRWNEVELNQLKKIPGSAFEAVDTGEIRK